MVVYLIFVSRGEKHKRQAEVERALEVLNTVRGDEDGKSYAVKAGILPKLAAFISQQPPIVNSERNKRRQEKALGIAKALLEEWSS